MTGSGARPVLCPREFEQVRRRPAGLGLGRGRAGGGGAGAKGGAEDPENN